ncbi:hypothetical protein L1987_63603 [Smallanthus sonchifolius]|uniref:Uncharacterized protein n=1 Tax=Smallanthus sonchifolius TaxID=185202 RepID=A0ACB9CDN7_9ASTR|nr:hypothetical protein L1987_63603 [Smallanthus sonchifolius]
MATHKMVHPSDRIKQLVDIIKEMFGSMDDGEINASAYDKAWVALVQDINGSGRPQFPSSLEWIVNNQLSDGSWGDALLFSAHDRIINTLACVIVLTFWNVHPSKCQQGLKFLKENISKLEDEDEEHMPIGFEVAFPSLAEMARKLKLEIPDSTPAIKEIYARRNLKLSKQDVMHKVPTTLLHSLEGMPDLKWEKLLKLQCKDGSLLFSPSSTAFALMQTKDEKCLQYLTNVVTKFNGGVPNVYPVDLFEHIWVVDRLQRLGIARYFEPEIKECVEYIHRHWTKDGICWAKNSNVQDIDDTTMGFRILRLYGYETSPDVFRQFEKDGKFVCFEGKSTQAVIGMFNLYRASQVLFPGEKILEDAKKFSYRYLKENQWKNTLLDKWIIAKDLPGEVGYALSVPWYASLPRLETRYYLEQYGGEDDVWIGKTLYRWYVNFGIKQLGASDISSLLVSYYVAAASIFEPERSSERNSWAKTTILVDTISKLFESPQLSKGDRRAFENGNTRCDNGATSATIDSRMQELVQLVLSDSPHDDLDRDLKQTFLTVARAFYYKAYFDHETINDHISKAMSKIVV